MSKTNDIKQRYIAKIVDKLNEMPVIDNDEYERLVFKIDKMIASRTRKSHKQAKVYNPIIDDYIEVDEGIAELLCHIWHAGIETLLSCENNIPDNYFWIDFYNMDNIKKFLTIVFTGTQKYCPQYKRAFWREDKRWLYRTIYENENSSDDSNDDTNDFDVNIVSVHTDPSIRIPKKDYKFVLERFKQYNNDNGIDPEQIINDIIYH